MDKRRGPLLNTREIDMAYYDELRKLFMAEYLKFRRGNLASYASALNNLIAMYSTLPAARHNHAKPTEAVEFLKSIDDFDSDLERYMQDGNKSPSKEHIKKIDEIHRKFMEIMYELEFTR